MMPVFSYICQPCGLKFERPGKASTAESPRPCPSCGFSSPRAVSSANFTFGVSATRPGVVTQNTGVSSFDYDADRIIGRESDEHWAVYEKRRMRKEAALRSSPGSTAQDLSVVPVSDEIGVDYRIMDKDEKATTRNTRAFHNVVTSLKDSPDRYERLAALSRASRRK